MPYILLQRWTKEFGTLSEKTFLGTTMALVGILIVFVILVIIVLSIFLMSAVVNKRRKKLIKTELLTGDADTISATLTDVHHETAIMQADVVEAEKTTYEDNEHIAVITAAIAMISSTTIGRGTPYPGFRVRSIKRTSFFNVNSNF